jgi:hypothetical protein
LPYAASGWNQLKEFINQKIIMEVIATVNFLEMQKLRYFEKKTKSQNAMMPAVHSDFLRTGRIFRRSEEWEEEEKRYLTYEEVAERTKRKLERAGEKTHQRLNNFHKDIQFPKLIFERTLAATPHLGYCHVTASRTKFAEYDNVIWAFYIANFYSEIGTGDSFFDRINMTESRMYFAVAMEAGKEEGKAKLSINRKVRGNGVLFRTSDPEKALKNVLMLGAKSEKLRAIVRALG